MKKSIMSCLVILGLLFASNGYSQQAKISQTLKEDMEIMETVLDKMFSTGINVMPSYFSNSKGFYLKDYGVIFHIFSPFQMSEMQLIMLEKMEKQLRAYTVTEERKRVVEGEKSKVDFQEKIAAVKSKIADFLGNYASSIRDLNDKESIALVVDFKATFPGFFWQSDDLPQQLVASVKVRDLKDYRRGKLSQKQFREKISYEEINTQSEDVSIFTNVVKTAMEHAGRKYSFRLDDDVQGIRFPGHGVLFLTTFNFNYFYNHAAELQELFEQAKAGGKNVNYKVIERKNVDFQKQIDELESKLIDLLANYGQTLRNLGDNEWVEFCINFKGNPRDLGFSRGIVKVQKKMIDDLNRRKVNEQQFRKAVKVIYY